MTRKIHDAPLAAHADDVVDRKAADHVISKQMDEIFAATPTFTMPQVVLSDEAAERYLRFANAAARLRKTGDAHMKAQDEYKQALGLLSASAEKLATGDGQTEPV